MKYLLNLLSKNKDYLIVLILSFFLSSPYIIDICSGYLSYYNFDLQEFLLWNYAAGGKITPYKDIFYSYGILSYFRNYNLLYAGINYLVPPSLFIIVFFLFKKIFQDKITLYFSTIIFYLFILILTGFQIFSRYGLLVVLSLFFSYLLYSANKETKPNVFMYSGVILGLAFSFVIDQGVYLIISFIFIFLLNRYFQVKKGKIIKEIIYLVLGFFIGIIPLLLYFQGNFKIITNYFKDVREIALVAKTPFISFIDSPANIFTIFILFFAIFFNYLKLFVFKQKLTLSSFFQISLIFVILVMEQKSMVRSIDRQIAFVSFVLLMFLVYELANLLKNKTQNKRIIYIILTTVIVVIYGFNVEHPITNFSQLLKNYNLLISKKCFANNLKSFLTNNPSYVKIINFLNRQSGFNGKVFSFPTGNSAFYVLLKQKPPFYNAIFEGASDKKKNLVIKYIQDNQIEYILLNTNKSSLQDAVPDYIRQSFLFKYILNNYQPLAVIGDHLILKKDKNNDFFASEILKQMKGYSNYLSDVYLYKIPYSEGLYKYEYLINNNKLIFESNNADAITFYSTNKVFVLSPSINVKSSSLSFIKLRTGNGNTTTIYYNPCKKNGVCIINLSKIPLFYKERMITKVILDKEFKGKIRIFNLKDPGNLW